MYLNQSNIKYYTILYNIEAQHLMYLNFIMTGAELTALKIEAQHLMYLNKLVEAGARPIELLKLNI